MAKQGSRAAKSPRIGDRAPAFQLKNHLGATERLADYAGRPLVIYFYPRDDTPGCTIEACSFRDSYAQFKKLAAAVVGISTDDQQSHFAFHQANRLNFSLLTDAKHRVAEKYGVWREKVMFGNRYFGIHRSTFLIDSNGRVARIWLRVIVKEHVREVVQALKELERQ